MDPQQALTHTVLGVDIGFWTFSYCIVHRGADGIYQIQDWRVLSLADEAGLPAARASSGGIKKMSQALLISITQDAMRHLFPVARVRHDFTHVFIESQPRTNGRACKMTELGMAVYSYFRDAASLRHACPCMRFPMVHLTAANAKFGQGSLFGLAQGPQQLGVTLKAKPSYEQRKAYAVRLATALLEEDDTAQHLLHTPPLLRERFHRAQKRDDLADSLILAGIGIRFAEEEQ